MGLSPDPGFAHNKHSAKPDCELYHPGLTNYASSPTIAAVASAEDGPDEIGMCLEDGESWTTYLRFPELSDLGKEVRLRSLQTGSVEVEGAGVRLSVSLMELRPGIGSARLLVPPTVASYSVAPRGVWPSSISQAPWKGTVRGLNPRGTVFRIRRGEWVRLKDDSAVELGEELRIVAESLNAPPESCSPKQTGEVSHNRLNWRMWRIVLPVECNLALERWAEGIRVVVLEPTWKLSILSIPQAFASPSRVPIFGVRETLIAKLQSPQPGAQTSLSLNVGASGQKVAVGALSGTTAFVSFTVAWPGANHFEVSDRTTGWFETEPKATIAELRKSLGTVPILKVIIGNSVAETWKAPLEIPALDGVNEPPNIEIVPALEDLRLSLHWEGSSGGGYEEGLTRESLKNRLLRFWGKDVEVRISAGALGWLGLLFRSPKRRGIELTNKRVLRWASIAAGSEPGSNGAWMLRRASVTDLKCLRVAQGKNRSRWTALAINHLKGPKG